MRDQDQRGEGTAEAGWAPYSDGAYLDYLGGFLRRCLPGSVEFGLHVARRHINSSGVVHGGLLATMLDHLIGQNCVMHGAERPYVTSNLNVSFLRAVFEGDFIHGTCTIRKAGRTAGYGDGVLAVGGKPVATGQAVFVVTTARS